MTPIADGTQVYIDTAEGTFHGTVMASGSQSQMLVYSVLLDNPNLWPGIQPGATRVVVPATSIRVDVEALTGVTPQPPEVPKPQKFIL
jgi:hypothetical protein